MSYLFDNNISHRFARMFQALDVDVLAVRDALREDADDVEILAWLEARNYVFVTVDRHIRTKPPEVAALKANNITALFLDRFWSKMEFWPQAAWLVARWPQIEDFTARASPGTCGRIQQRGRIVYL